MMKLTGDRMCFACGEDNPISLGLKFSCPGDRQVQAKFTPTEHHQGFDEIMHGGLIGTLLDEAMAKAIYFQGVRAVTAEIKTRFKKAVRIGEKLEVTGKLVKAKGKLYYTEAQLKNSEGQLKATAEAKFIKLKEESG